MKKSTYLFAIALGVSTISLAQNVGINTDGSDPDTDALLHLLNTNSTALDPLIRLENQQGASVNGIELLNSGAATAAEWDLYIPSTTTDFRVSNGTTDHVTIQNDGDVGIGTTTPSVPLDIEATNAAIDINNTSTDPLIHFQVSGTTNFTIGTDVTDSKFKIGTTALETGTAITVQSTGEVGIGTTSPTAKLDVDGSAIFNESHAAVDFRVEGDAEANLLFVDGSADMVGIGTATPAAELDVSGNLQLTGSTTETRKIEIGQGRSGDGHSLIDLVGDATYSDYGARIVRYAGANAGTDILHRGTGNLKIYTWDAGDMQFATNSTLRMTLGSGGLLGIGRVAATNILEINGDASKTSSGDWLANSDARLKKEIKQMDSQEVLNKMLQLNGITYLWNDTITGNDRPTQLQYGFTAQNIQEVFPLLVQEDALGYLQTAYGTYDAMYVESMRALQQQINKQQAIIEAQKKEIENLKQETSSASTDNAKKFAALEAKLNALLLNQNVTLSAKK